MDHKKIVRILKHHTKNVTDVNSAGSTIKMHNKTTMVQGIDTDYGLPDPGLLKVSDNVTYVVGCSDGVTNAMIDFAKALREDMQYNVIYDTKQNAIVPVV